MPQGPQVRCVAYNVGASSPKDFTAAAGAPLPNAIPTPGALLKAMSQGQQPQQQPPPAPAQGTTLASSQGQQPQQPPPAHPHLAMAPDDIERFSRSRVVSFKQAHRFLTKLRDRHRDTQDDTFWHDLTDTQEFHWRAWVAQRPDAKDIVGPGISAFAFVWLASRDTNLNERRGDFMVQRDDGVDIRLHPQHKANPETGLKEAFPVRGSWAQEWDPATTPIRQHAALAAPQDHYQNSLTPTAFLGMSAADASSRKDAIWFLNRERAAWEALPHPRRPFRTDITSAPASSRGQFHWPYFVQPRAWFKNFFEAEGKEITTFEVAFSKACSHAVFLGRRSDGRMFVVNPRARNQLAELSWDPDGHDIAEL